MSHDFIQNAVNAMYQSNELMALKGELANLKAERDQLKADLEKSDGVVWTLSVENASLKAKIERLTEAGDEMAFHIGNDEESQYKCADAWRAAKGVQS
jgi:predicted  nucleic acid-binding Zn-ribbon protein